MRFLALQANSNIVSAVTGGTADTGVIPATIMAPALARSDLKLLTWVGDEVQWQSSALIASPKELNERGDVFKRFLTGLRRGLHDFHDAFTAADGTRHDGLARMRRSPSWRNISARRPESCASPFLMSIPTRGSISPT